MPIYFTSKGLKYLKYMLDGSPYSQKNNPTVRVVGVEDLNRENLEVKIDYLSITPQDFYYVFVDMLISHGQGGYGEYKFLCKIGLTAYKFK